MSLHSVMCMYVHYWVLDDRSLLILSTFLHQLIVRGPGLSFYLKFCLLSWHIIHINGSPLLPQPPWDCAQHNVRAISSPFSSLEILLKADPGGPGRLGWGAQQGSRFCLYPWVISCLGFSSVFQSCVSICVSLLLLLQASFDWKLENSCWYRKKEAAALSNPPKASPECSLRAEIQRFQNVHFCSISEALTEGLIQTRQRANWWSKLEHEC